MTATTASTRGISSNAGPGFGSTLVSEWTKLRSVRSTWIILGLAIALSIGFSALMSFVTGVTFDDWGPNEQATFDPVINSTIGVLFSIILLIVLGVTAVTSEYGSRMIRTTFIVTPRRTRVLAAKVMIVGLIGVIVSAITAPGMFLVSQAIFGAYGLQTASITDSDATRFLAVYVPVAGLVYTLIPLAIGFLLRGTASAVTVSIGLFFLPWMFAPLMPNWVQENVLRYLPDIAMDSLAGITATDATTYLSDGPAIVVIVAWLVVALGTAAVVLNRRDA